MEQPKKEVKERGKKFGSITAVIIKNSKLVKLLKSAKFLKPLFSVLTMVGSMASYSYVYGVVFGASLTLLILLHEMGHVIALKKLNYKISLPIFIPFLGAAIFTPKIPNRIHESIVGIGGPLLGTIAAAISFIPFYITQKPLYAGIAYIGIILNMFNMIPISPLDGGRITQTVSKYFKWLGILALLAFTFYSKDAGMLMVWILVMWDINIGFKYRAIFALLIFGLMLFAGFGLHMYERRTTFIMDVIATGIFTSVICILTYMVYFQIKNKHYSKEELYNKIEEPDDRPVPPLKQRVIWLTYYLLLLSVQLGLGVYFHHFIK